MASFADRIKDLTSLAGVRNNQLVGYGLVVGLSGTGDANLGLTIQSMQAMLSRFGMSTDAAGLSGACLLYTSPSPRDPKISRMPSSA